MHADRRESIGHDAKTICGGFILKDAQGNFSVVRWAVGDQNSIFVPPHPGCKIEGIAIVASFHTHPNTGGDYLQEPSETDKRSLTT